MISFLNDYNTEHCLGNHLFIGRKKKTQIKFIHEKDKLVENVIDLNREIRECIDRSSISLHLLRNQND